MIKMKAGERRRNRRAEGCEEKKNANKVGSVRASMSNNEVSRVAGENVVREKRKSGERKPRRLGERVRKRATEKKRKSERY